MGTRFWGRIRGRTVICFPMAPCANSDLTGFIGGIFAEYFPSNDLAH
jgi:hypothetical protein